MDLKYVETEAGIKYRIVEKGAGDIPLVSDTISCHYEGRLRCGKVFDSSYERGRPTEFPLDKIIPGWQRVICMMPVGSTWEVVIPPELGYGDQVVGEIPANSTLTFVINLLSIMPKSTSLRS